MTKAKNLIAGANIYKKAAIRIPATDYVNYDYLFNPFDWRLNREMLRISACSKYVHKNDCHINKETECED